VITVAITGPTGDIGRSLMRSLERSRQIGELRAMARRPFHPGAHGLRRVRYRRGDVLDPASLRELCRDADVVVHLAFVIIGGLEETTSVNLQGSRNVFAAAREAGARRLVYASSVAAYGFHRDRPRLLTEELAPRGTERHYYSRQKAQLESVLAEELAGSSTEAYLFRPCIVAGPDALALVRNLPFVALSQRTPAALRSLARRLPGLAPVLPDPGVPFQLVHHDDVASAMRAAILGRGSPGVYNLAGEGQLTVSELARALGWWSVPLPRPALDAAAELVARLPLMPAEAQWIEAFREPALMDASKARRELRWRPRHDAQETLAAMVRAAREQGLIGPR
jgi:UDP-glucose 4-epimerase